MGMIRKLWDGAKKVAREAKALAVSAAAGLGGLLGLSQAPDASAAVPAGVETLFTTTATDFGTVLGYGYVLFLAVVGGLIIIKLVKKVFFKST
jgi:hypothetical protein